MPQESSLFITEILQEIEDSLTQKHDRLLDLAGLDAIPTEILPILKPHIQKAIALLPTTSPRILIDLTKSEYLEVRQALLRNQNIFPQLLEILSLDNSKEVRYLVQNHFQKPIIFDYYLWHLSPNYYLPSENYSEDEHSQYTYDFLYVQQIASNPNTTPNTLRKFASDNSWLLRHRIAMNPSTPKDTLAKLAEDVSIDKMQIPRVKMAVAKNPNTSSETLAKLIEHDCDIVVCEVATNSNLPINLQFRLAKFSNNRIRNHLATNSNLAVDVIEYLAKNHLQDCLNNVLKNPRCPQYILENIDNYSTQSLVIIAKHFKTSIDTLKKLSKMNHINQHHLDIALVSNKNTPSSVLSEIYQRNFKQINTPKQSWQIGKKNQNKTYLEILIGLIINQNCSITILNQLKNIITNKNSNRLSITQKTPILSRLNSLINRYGDDRISSRNIFYHLARNSKTPRSILEELYKLNLVGGTNYFCETLAENVNTPLYILNSIYRKKSKRLKRSALNRMITIYEEITKNPQTSIAQLQEILYHENAQVRHTLKHHPQGIQLLLGRCLKHKNDLARFLAGLHPQLSLSQRQELVNSDHKFDRLAIKPNPQ